jgi:large subunit ribosomal protein LP0
MKAALNYRNSEPTEAQEDYEERKDNWKAVPRIERLIPLFKGNVGAIFTNGDFNEIKDVIDSHKREAPAKIGSLAQEDVWIRAGSTGLDPKQTAFFQTLQI